MISPSISELKGNTPLSPQAYKGVYICPCEPMSRLGSVFKENLLEEKPRSVVQASLEVSGDLTAIAF